MKYCTNFAHLTNALIAKKQDFNLCLNFSLGTLSTNFIVNLTSCYNCLFSLSLTLGIGGK